MESYTQWIEKEIIQLELEIKPVEDAKRAW
jgi:hypothetical protein